MVGSVPTPGRRLPQLTNMANPQQPVQVGDTIAEKYLVEHVLGEGGGGVVVRARHRVLQHAVAIKILHNHEDPQHVARFLREARAATRIKSEHVGTVTDVGELPGGGPYMVMEFLEGEDLGAIVERAPLALPDAVDFLLQACEGIAQAHALGIVHRDLKPQNLFVTRRAHGRPVLKVLDFGLARVITEGTGKESALTQENAVMGSPPYMSPEQIRSTRDVDTRTDLWSLGVCFYEMLTGKLPFEGSNAHHILALILAQPPTPIERWLPDLPGALREVLQRCLTKEPEGRFRTVAELAEAVEPFAPPSSKGAANRVRDILFAPQVVSLSAPPPAMPAPAADAKPMSATDFPSSFDTGRTPPRRRLLVALAGGAIVVVPLVILAAIRFAPAPTVQGSTDRGPPATSVAVVSPASSATATPSVVAEALDAAPRRPVEPPVTTAPAPAGPPPRLAPRPATGPNIRSQSESM